MTNLWITGFKAALLRKVQVLYPDADHITSWDEEINLYAGESGCDTCGWGADDPYGLTIHFAREDGSTGAYYSTTPFGELVYELSQEG